MEWQLSTEASAKESFEIYAQQPPTSDWHHYFLREGRRVYGNSGVLLYDLTRARAARFAQKAIPDSARLFAKRQPGEFLLYAVTFLQTTGILLTV